jgi:protein-S-isoprenylcysteine O-methyltransferase Ste14
MAELRLIIIDNATMMFFNNHWKIQMLEGLLEAICWGTVIFVWIIGAIYNYLKVPVIRKGNNSIQMLLPIVLVWAVMEHIPKSYWALITYEANWSKFVGAIVLVVFTIFTLWSRIVLGKMWSGRALIKENHELHTEGPYSITRHPIYAGILGMLLGTAFIIDFGVFLAFFLCVFILFKVKINNEEKLLIETFGEEYKAFQKRTPQLFFRLRFSKK